MILVRNRVFGPQDLPAVLGWWDFSTMPVIAGDSVDASRYTRVTDRSGRRNHMGPPTVGSSSTCHSGFKAPNGLRVAGAQGNGIVMTNEAGDIRSYGIKAATIIVVASAPADNTTGNFCQYWGTSGQLSHHSYSDGNMYDDFMSSTRYSFPRPSSLIGPKIAVIRGKLNAYSFTVNNRLWFSSSTNTPGLPAVGGNQPKLSDFGGGSYMCEAVLCAAYLSDTMLAKITRSLAAKWGISL